MGKRDKRIRAQEQAESNPKPAQDQIAQPVVISFRYVEPGGKFCLSHCDTDAVRAYKDCLKMMTQMTYHEIAQTGGKAYGGKTGLGYQPYDDKSLKKVTRPDRLDKTVKISAVRASQQYRMFGAFMSNVYYILWFDPNHEIVPARH